MSAAPLPIPQGASPRTARSDLAVYAFVVFAWGTSWVALRMQVGVVAPEVSVVWRFALSAVVMGALALAHGERLLGYVGRVHARLAAVGATMFSLNFILFYHGAASIPSGLLSVIFSLASVLNLALGALFFSRRIEGRAALGAVLGTLGIALLFLPELAATDSDGAVLRGLALCVAGTLSFCFGNLLAAGAPKGGPPVLAAATWSMVYGTLAAALAALALGRPFAFDPSLRYVGSLLWLVVVASVGAFWAYMTLLRRIGPARAAYATVLFPLVALAVSTLFEGYVWTLPAAIGAALALGGNVLVLGGRR